jgi:hypothetical protein
MPKLYEIPAALTLTSADTLVMVRDNGDGTHTDYRIAPENLGALTSKEITVGTGGTTLSDAFFSNTIRIILTDGQAYIRNVHFTQASTTITGTAITFYAGQKLIAMI